MTKRLPPANERSAIAGYQRISLVDYPGQIASTLFFSGCNFRCDYCHNPELVNGRSPPLSLAKIYAEIAANKNIDGVCLSGGEPTIHVIELKKVILKIKSFGLLVKLDTNGARPDILKELAPYLDYVAMDIKTTQKKYHHLTKIKGIQNLIDQSMAFIMRQNNFAYEFRTTLVPGYVERDNIRDIGKNIGHCQKWFLQIFRNQKTLGTINKKFSQEQVSEIFSLAKTIVPACQLRGLSHQ